MKQCLAILICVSAIALHSTGQGIGEQLVKAEERDDFNGWNALEQEASGLWLEYIQTIRDTADASARISKWREIFLGFEEEDGQVGMMLSATHLGAELAMVRQVDEAKIYCQTCIDLASDYSKIIAADCYISMATACRFNAEYQMAHSYADRAIQGLSEMRQNGTYGRALFSKGSIYHYNDRLDSAMLYYTSAAEVMLPLNDTIQLAKVYNNLGILAETMGDFAASIDYHKRSLKYKQALGDASQIATSYLGLGNVQLSLQNWDSAAYYFGESAKTYEKLNDAQGQIWALNNIANAAYYSGDFINADANFKKGLRIALQLNDSSEISRLYANVGWSSLSLKKPVVAKVMFDSALYVAENLDSYQAQEQAHSGLADYYIDQDDYERALHHYSLSRDFKDKALNESRMEQMVELQTKYTVLEKEKAIAELAQANTEAELQLSNQRAWLIALGLGFLLTMSLGGFVVIRRRHIAQAELARRELDFRKKLVDSTVLAEEKERQRIAKDLHDGVVQSLAALKLGVQAAMNKAQLSNQQEEMFGMHIESIDQAAEEARSISHRMMPRALEESGLIVAISDMLDKVMLASDIKYNFEHYGFGDERVTPSIEIGLYRICQELVNNILKHSGASEVIIQLIKTKDQIILHVEDNGQGFDTKHSSEASGIGMHNIYSRASAVNGEVSYESNMPEGTIASIRVPVA